MIDTELYTIELPDNPLNCDDVNYDPDKPKIKTILWDHYDWFVEMDEAGRRRYRPLPFLPQ